MQRFRVQYCAAALLFQNCPADQRAARATEQVQALVALLENSPNLKSAEKTALDALIIDRGEGWSDTDRAFLLDAVARATEQRRKAQKWGDAMLRIFTANEWQRWKAIGVAGMGESSSEIIARVKSLGGKNLSEYDKKLLAAVWLHVRGDGRMTNRATALQQFKNTFSRATRFFEPAVYLEVLPPVHEIENFYPDLYVNAYTANDPPSQLSDADVGDIKYLDMLMRCRSGDMHTNPALMPSQQMPSQQLLSLPMPAPSLHPLGAQQLQQQQPQPINIMQAMMMQQQQILAITENLRNLAADSDAAIPGLEVLSPRPGGRPMRGLGMGNASNQRSAPNGQHERTLPQQDAVVQHERPQLQQDAATPRVGTGSSNMTDQVAEVAKRMLRKRKTTEDDDVDDDEDLLLILLICYINKHWAI